MNHRRFALPLFVAGLAGFVEAQDLSCTSVLVQRPCIISAGNPAQIPPEVIAAGTDIRAGVNRVCLAPEGNGTVTGMFHTYDQRLWMHLHASASVNGGVVPNASASSGNPVADIQLHVPRAMPVRFELSAFGLGSHPTHIGRVRIDIAGHDGVELEFEAVPGTCSNADKSLVVDLPAGLAVVRVELQAELPVGAVGAFGEFVQASASVTVEPAHVAVQHESGDCGASLELTPMLDGQGLRCHVGPSYPATSVWLVFGLQPTNVLLPSAPGCSLLVDPLVVLPIQPMAFTTLPFGGLGPIELKVQGVMLQPANPWLIASGLLTSHRATLTVR
jgi:hypothetical protein